MLGNAFPSKGSGYSGGAGGGGGAAALCRVSGNTLESVVLKTNTEPSS